MSLWLIPEDEKFLTLPPSPPAAGKPGGEVFLFDPPLPPRKLGGFVPHWGAAIPGGAAQSAAAGRINKGAIRRLLRTAN